MSYEGIVQVQNEDNPTDVNRRLSEGWELLSVNPGREPGDLLYTLGRRGQKKATEIPKMDLAGANKGLTR